VGTVTKLSRVGNSTGLTIPKELLEAANMARGDEVALTVVDGKIEICRNTDGYNKAMAAGRRFAGRYAKTMAALAK